MSDSVNPTVDRIFAREVWAMSWIGHHLTTLPESALLWTVESLDRDLGEVFAHIVERQFECVQRNTGEATPVVLPPRSEEELEVGGRYDGSGGCQLHGFTLAQ